MTRPLHIALTADLHWGARHGTANVAVERLAAALRKHPPDLLIIAGDIGTVGDFEECLARFDELSCLKALVPGNHDIWVEANDARGDSWAVYQQHLPTVASRHGFHYLDTGPLLLKDHDLAVVGSINWYDYSWAADRLAAVLPDWETFVRDKRFLRGRHNDGRFVRWALDDRGFTARVVERMAADLETALGEVSQAIVVTHHPPMIGLNYPVEEDQTVPVDRLLWEAYSGNRAMEDLLTRYAERIPWAFCGHTHYARENRLGPVRGQNIGGDYHFKRLLRLTWPTGTLQAEEFHIEEAE